MIKSRPNFIVGIGGSAGGLKAYLELLENLSPNTGMAFVIIAHLSPTHESPLAQILSRSTKMPVIQASQRMPILANHVYVIPPNTNLLMKNYAFKVVSPRTMKEGRHRQVDCFLTSLAENMGPRAIGIILSGGDGDGTEGCKLIKTKGGKTFAQDLSADIGSMPLHAQASGYVDFVLPPHKIADELNKISALFVREGVTLPPNLAV